jgi:addiction module HigA family antidote
MSSTRINQYCPDYLTTPGEVLLDYLEDLGMTQAELADRTGLAKKTINEIVRGKSQITPETARKLEKVLGRPAHFWSNLERQYQDDKARLAERERMECGVYGATRWIDDKPVIQLSLRYKSNDHLWFTFFHEAGHILKHGRRDVFIEFKGIDSEKEEDEANAFACDKLIPPAALKAFVQRSPFSRADIVAFADEIGIAPGIVLGRLQHDNILPFTHYLNSELKIFYEWGEGA